MFRKEEFWAVGKRVLGVVLIAGGVVGLFLPFFQGIAMIIAGAVLLGNEKALNAIKRWVAQLKKCLKR